MSTTSKNTIYWASQILGWALFYLLVLGLNIVVKTVIPTTSFYIYAIEGVTFSILATHLIRFIIIKYDWLNLSIVAIIWRSILITILSAILVESIEYTSTLFIPKDFYTDLNMNSSSLSKILGSILGNVFLFCIWLSFYYAYLFIEKSRNQEPTIYSI